MLEPIGLDARPASSLTRVAKIALWVALLFSAGAGGEFQHRTGPSYPIPVHTKVAGAKVVGQLPPSHPGEGAPRFSSSAKIRRSLAS